MIDRIKLLANRASVFHGVLAGVFIFMAKVVVYVTQHWEFRFLPAFSILSFCLVLAAMVMGGLGDKRQLDGAHYNYKRALFSCLRAVFFAVAIGSMADNVLYGLIDASLAEQTKSILIEQVQAGMAQTKWMSNDQIDAMVKGIGDTQLGGFWAYLSGIPSLVLGNMLFGLIVARFLRVKKKQDWLNDSESTS